MSYIADPNPIFQPANRLVTAITQADAALVTTSFDHDYIIGTIVRFFIPNGYGMDQLDLQTGAILTIPTSTTFTVDIDTRDYNAFMVPASPQQFAQVTAIGEITLQTYAATMNVLPPK
jgi:uncharacterized membrane protein